MNSVKLKAEMILYGDNQNDLAEALSLSRQTANQKINDLADWKDTEIKIVIDRYKLEPETVNEIWGFYPNAGEKDESSRSGETT